MSRFRHLNGHKNSLSTKLLCVFLLLFVTACQTPVPLTSSGKRNLPAGLAPKNAPIQSNLMADLVKVKRIVDGKGNIIPHPLLRKPVELKPQPFQLKHDLNENYWARYYTSETLIQSNIVCPTGHPQYAGYPVLKFVGWDLNAGDPVHPLNTEIELSEWAFDYCVRTDDSCEGNCPASPTYENATSPHLGESQLGYPLISPLNAQWEAFKFYPFSGSGTPSGKPWVVTIEGTGITINQTPENSFDYTWEGKDSQGQYVTDGRYHIVMRSGDEITDALSVLVDNTQPVVEDIQVQEVGDRLYVKVKAHDPVVNGVHANFQLPTRLTSSFLEIYVNHPEWGEICICPTPMNPDITDIYDPTQRWTNYDVATQTFTFTLFASDFGMFFEDIKSGQIPIKVNMMDAATNIGVGHYPAQPEPSPTPEPTPEPSVSPTPQPTPVPTILPSPGDICDIATCTISGQLAGQMANKLAALGAKISQIEADVVLLESASLPTDILDPDGVPAPNLEDIIAAPSAIPSVEPSALPSDEPSPEPSASSFDADFAAILSGLDDDEGGFSTQAKLPDQPYEGYFNQLSGEIGRASNLEARAAQIRLAASHRAEALQLRAEALKDNFKLYKQTPAYKALTKVQKQNLDRAVDHVIQQHKLSAHHFKEQSKQAKQAGNQAKQGQQAGAKLEQKLDNSRSCPNFSCYDRPLKGKQADEVAKLLGYNTKKSADKAPFDSHRQPVYTNNGRKYITPDIDGHSPGYWKMFEQIGGRFERTGTYNIDLTVRIKD